MSENYLSKNEVDSLYYWSDGVRLDSLYPPEEIDAPIAEKPCKECGNTRRYVAVFNKGRSYRAFAVCDTCENAIEF